MLGIDTETSGTKSGDESHGIEVEAKISMTTYVSWIQNKDGTTLKAITVRGVNTIPK